MEKLFNILAVGDVVGRAGRSVLATRLRGLIDLHRIDFVIVNGENSAGGRSITPEIYREFLDLDVDVVTTGNHVWDNNDVLKIIDQEDRLLRPHNFLRGKRQGHLHREQEGQEGDCHKPHGRSMMEPIDCPSGPLTRFMNHAGKRATW
jgi:calcineurin-like phosphoesterase